MRAVDIETGSHSDPEFRCRFLNESHQSPTDSFIHSGHFYSAPSSPSSTTQRRSRLQHGYYFIGVSRRSAQATVGKGLVQGPYMAARAGVEPTTLRLKAIDSTKAPPCPTIHISGFIRVYFTSSLFDSVCNSIQFRALDYRQGTIKAVQSLFTQLSCRGSSEF